MPKLGVNIDHVATLREARKGFDPDPVQAALICEKMGVDSIVCHLREDRRHINEHDVERLRKVVKKRLNLEMSINKNIVKLALKLKPEQATLVPERRQEITTEGGLDVVKHFSSVKKAVDQLGSANIDVSLFIDPVKQQIDKAFKTDAPMIELHTGCYALARTKEKRLRELNKLKKMTRYARDLGLIVHAGHGLNYDNTRPVARIKGIHELNIGHSIIAQSVFDGLKLAIKNMKILVR